MSALSLPAVLTMSEARATLALLEPALQSGTETVIDASALQALDTAAIAVLLQCERVAAAAGRKLKIEGMPPKLAELARLYGVEALLGVAPAA